MDSDKYMEEKPYSFSKKFIEGETVSGFWSLVFYGVTALNSFIIIYFLSVYEFGFYQLVLSVITIAESLTAGFLDDLVFTDLSRYLGSNEKILAKRLFKEYALLKLGLVILLLGAILGGAEIISQYYGGNIALFLRIASVALFFRVGLSTMNLFFGSAIYFSAVGASVFGESVKFFAILGMLMWGGLGIVQILIAYVIGHIAAFIFSSSHFVKLYRKTFIAVKNQKLSLVKDLVKIHGVWIFFRYVMSRVANNIRPWIIKIFIGTEAVGLFAFARNLIAIILRLMPLGTFGILLPRELGNQVKLKYFFTRVTKYSVFLGFIFSVISFIGAPIFVNLFFPKYNFAMPLFKIMVAIIFLYSLYKIFRMTLVAFKEQKLLAVRSFDNSVLAPMMLFVLLPIFGVNGAAIEWVLTYAITTALFYYYLVKAHPYLKLKWKDFILDRHDGVLILKIYQQGISFFKSKLKKFLRLR